MDYADYSEQADTFRLIGNIPIFAGVGIHEQHLMANRCEIVQYGPDEIVIEQGEVGNCLYAIIRGQVRILRRSSSRGWIQINTLGQGDVFGEIAILRDIPRTARVTTETACTFLTLQAKDFLELYQHFPPQSRDNIQLVIAKRLAQHKD